MKTTLSIAFLIIASLVFAQKAPSKLYYYRNAPTYTEATLYWSDNSADETGFTIESKTDNGSWTVVANVNANTTSYNLTSLNPSESLNLKVKATNGSSYSNEVRIVGTASKLEVYNEVPGIRNPKDTTISGITFGMIQNQCPSDPSKGKVTKISTVFNVQVRLASETDFKNSPTYQTSPQIRNSTLAQNDPANTGGHRPYGYGEYGPRTTNASRLLHSRHWTNFDAAEDVVVRITVANTGSFKGPININDLQIHPTPINVTKVDDYNIDVTLPGATTFARHYRVAVNKSGWSTVGGRAQSIYEAPLFVFVNPVQVPPASAPEGEVKQFNNGSLVVFGAGIHLPTTKAYRFFGTGENQTCREMYIPGDAYLHYGFIFNNPTWAVKVNGRGIYSDEMFAIYKSVDPLEYVYNSSTRTPWSSIECTAGNTWNKKPTNWEGRVGFYSKYSQPTIFEGLTNIGGRMGVVNDGGNAQIINHKDVGYGGSTYQMGTGSKTLYLGCMLVNDDDITYVHEDYWMDHCTTFNLHNGPSFQYGWGLTTNYSVKTKITNHTILSSDKIRTDSYGKNHGVFNSRLNIGQLKYHNGGIVENIDAFGTELIFFHIRLWDEGEPLTGLSSFFEDKVYKNINIYNKPLFKNKLWCDVNTSKTQDSYIRFLHFDNLAIAGNQIENINDGNNFEYNSGVLLHTITFFSLPAAVTAPESGVAPLNQAVNFYSKLNNKIVFTKDALPQSFAPLSATATVSGAGFTVVDAGDGYVALRSASDYYVKADNKRYGYVYTLPDTKRGDADVKTITEDAKFKWVDLGDGKFALYSKSMGLYVRTESNCGPEMPLYAASAVVGDAETFVIGQPTTSVRNNSQKRISIYPNPCSEFFVINGIEYGTTLEIFNMQGQLIQTKYLQVGQNKIDISTFRKGSYILKLSDSKGVINEKLIVN